MAQSDITIVENYVLVRSSEVPNERSARALCDRIDGALKANQLRAVIFDTRETAPPPADASDAVWEWTRKGRHHSAVAIVVRSELRTVSANMTAISGRIPLRSFNDFEEAERFVVRMLKTRKAPVAGR